MTTQLFIRLVLAAALCGEATPLFAEEAAPAATPLRQQLIGTWRMVSMDEEGPGGAMTHHTERSGQLLYTADGRVSVQVMYPESEIGTSANAAYQQGGYEASFGVYEVDEQAHTVTNHYEGSLVRRLIGKPLARVMQFSPDGHLTLRAADPNEKWSVTWERYR
jgi:hypothetical protein